MFTRPTYALEKRFLRDSLLPTIKNQISHLSTKRTKVIDEKIGEDLWKEISNDLEQEISRFVKALTPEYTTLWRLKSDLTISVVPTQNQSSFPTFVSYVPG
jgi:hypothetical protein